MADGFAAIQQAAAQKRNAGGKVASNLQRMQGGKSAGPDAARGGAIARRLAKGSSKSGPPAKNDNDGDEHDYR